MGFPLISQALRSDPSFSYLDSAATSQIEEGVLAAMDAFERASRANVHRGVYRLAEEASGAYDRAREVVGRFFGGDGANVAFTHGATEALNLAALGWGGANLHEGDLVLIDTVNHHSNIVPWQMLARDHGIELAFVGVGVDGRLDERRFDRLLERGPKVVALAHMSNVTGLACDAACLTHEAHKAGAAVVLDCAQSAGHLPLDLTKIDADFAAVSAHKMHGPFGIGALWAKLERLEETCPILGGGGMVATVTEEGFGVAPVPDRLEAGTPNVSGAVGFAAACAYLERMGLERVRDHGTMLVDQAMDALSQVGGVRIVGDSGKGQRASLVSFSLAGAHPHDVADVLADEGVCVRAGLHCAQPLHRAMGLPATVRASFSLHSRPEEADVLARAVGRAKEVLSGD